jgi:NADH-quinone oxidoreductase subunit K
MIPLSYYLSVAAFLFFLGVVGILTRKNTLVILMCIELMMNAVNLTFVALSAYLHSLNGQMFVFFVTAVAAAEVSVGLAIIIAIFRNKATVDVDKLDSLQG